MFDSFDFSVIYEGICVARLKEVGWSWQRNVVQNPSFEYGKEVDLYLSYFVFVYIFVSI